jgi:mycothiol synthase
MTIQAPVDTGIGRVTFRAFDPAADFRVAAGLISDAHAHDDVNWLPTPESLAHDWLRTPGFNPVADVLIAESGGLAVGLVAVDWRSRHTKVVHQVEIWVRPSSRRNGIGGMLLAWAEDHARETVTAGTGGPTDLPHEVGGWGDADVDGHDQLAASRGYRVTRYGFEMRRRVDDPIPDVALPDGLEVRAVRPEDHRTIWDADVQAFRDHFEASVRTEADYDQWITAPTLDTSLWQVAWAGDEVAGSVITSINPEENEKLGVKIAWLDHISVRRPWRKRGVASALIASTLHILRERGIEIAALGVDAENPTGALRVYEAMGFARHKTGISYRKPLDTPTPRGG